VDRGPAHSTGHESVGCYTTGMSSRAHDTDHVRNNHIFNTHVRNAEMDVQAAR
jgi:hypothetical protein